MERVKDIFVDVKMNFLWSYAFIYDVIYNTYIYINVFFLLQVSKCIHIFFC